MNFENESEIIWNKLFKNEFANLNPVDEVLWKRFCLLLIYPKFQEEYNNLVRALELVLSSEYLKMPKNYLNVMFINLVNMFEASWGVVIEYELEFLVRPALKCSSLEIINQDIDTVEVVDKELLVKIDFNQSLKSIQKDIEELFKKNESLDLNYNECFTKREKDFKLLFQEIINSKKITEVFHSIPQENWLNIFRKHIERMRNGKSKRKTATEANTTRTSLRNNSIKIEEMCLYFYYKKDHNEDHNEYGFEKIYNAIVIKNDFVGLECLEKEALSFNTWLATQVDDSMIPFYSMFTCFDFDEKSRQRKWKKLNVIL